MASLESRVVKLEARLPRSRASSGSRERLARRLMTLTERIRETPPLPENSSIAEILCGAPCTDERRMEFEAFIARYPGLGALADARL